MYAEFALLVYDVVVGLLDSDAVKICWWNLAGIMIYSIVQVQGLLEEIDQSS